MRVNLKGFSIVELLVATSITAMVALGVAIIIINAQKASQFATIQNDIDRIHYLNIQIARNVGNIQKLYNIVPPNPGNTTAMKCLQMAPTANCANFQKPISISSTSKSQKPNLLIGKQDNGFPLPSSETDIQSTVTITPHCTGVVGCDYINVDVKTAYTGTSSASYVIRESSANLPNFLFVSRSEITYKCPNANQVMVGIDYYNQTPICNTVTTGNYGKSNTATNGSYLPLVEYDSGSTLAATNATACATGYGTATFSNSVCLPAGSMLTTPTTTVPPSSNQWCYFETTNEDAASSCQSAPQCSGLSASCSAGSPNIQCASNIKVTPQPGGGSIWSCKVKYYSCDSSCGSSPPPSPDGCIDVVGDALNPAQNATIACDAVVGQDCTKADYYPVACCQGGGAPCSTHAQTVCSPGACGGPTTTTTVP